MTIRLRDVGMRVALREVESPDQGVPTLTTAKLRERKLFKINEAVMKTFRLRGAATFVQGRRRIPIFRNGLCGDANFGIDVHGWNLVAFAT
ncbi:hypothetical protein [Neorhizobium sp. T7_12]|uniref:hypothetical protein n=1 Tax=Neorhizobium sp. T7_12 TaxID=2093832 RepID=UPI001FE0A585|nr:hypothetical protein [Neorhizobium sp. T7_12]